MMVIYVDVDDTFVRSFGSKRIPMSATLEYLRRLRERGATLYCWSSGGSEYARRAAEECGVADCFTAFLPKPQVLLDDVLFQDWRVLELHPNQCRSEAGDRLLSNPGGE